MDHVGGEDQRNAKARFLDGDPLQLPVEGDLEPVEIARRPALAHIVLRGVPRDPGAAERIDLGIVLGTPEHRKLAGLLLEGHPPQQILDVKVHGWRARRGPGAGGQSRGRDGAGEEGPSG